MQKEINLFDNEIEISAEEKQEKLNEKEVHAYVKKIIEALLFASNEPLSFDKIREIVDLYHPLKPRALHQLINELQEEHKSQNRPFKIEEVAQGYILVTLKEFSYYIDQIHRNKRTEKLSQAAAEVLAIIAYKQPITKPQIDAIRGVDSAGTLQSILERGLVEVVGKLETPGRPTLYGITKDFLTHFGLKDLNALPKLRASSQK